MRDLSFFNKIFIATQPVDFRKKAHGLSVIVEHSLQQKGLQDKALFVFTNRRKTAVKILYWDTTGYAMWWKTLEKDRFRWPKSGSAAVNIEVKQLRWLLEGVDLQLIKRHDRVNIA